MRRWSLGILRQVLSLVLSALHLLTVAMVTTFKSRTALQVENIALRHQLAVLRRSVKRPKLTPADRLLWAWLCEAWSDWRSFLVVVKPETVIGWHRKGFRLFWTWKVRHGQPGPPPVSKEIRQLIRKMSRENPLWGAPAFTVNCSNSVLISARPAWESTSYASRSRRRKPGGPSWRTTSRLWCRSPTTR